MNLAIKSNLFSALLIQLKMDEFSGTRLYNQAWQPYLSVAWVDVSDVQWVYYAETVDSTVVDRPDYLYCNRENYTYVGDHCEYYQCPNKCYNKYLAGRIGHCRGWTDSECAFLNTTNWGIVYSSDYNDYLHCWRYCKNCATPYLNAQCSACVTGAYQYIDTQNLYAVATYSCWSECPDGTYPNNQTMTCLDCPYYCVCSQTDPSYCQRSINSTFLIDVLANRCWITCPQRTLYNPLV